ncbi:MAG TPA: hypothetical protein VLY20_08995 [Nitrospiria bacterium]|nr:hypothetical protein [Nitrospiria bacterium]
MFKMKTWLILAALLGFASPTYALEFEVYPYETPSQGETELAYWWIYTVKSDNSYDYFGRRLDKQGLQQHTIEVEYGMTDHWTVSAYTDFEKPNDGDFRYVQARAVVSRYRFFEQGERFLDGAIEIEYYLPRDKFSDSEEIETRVIFEKDIGRLSIRLNPIFEKDVSGPDVNEGMEFEYAAGLYYRATPRWTPGLEFYGKTGELGDPTPKGQQEHYIFPRLGVNFYHGVSLDVGYGFGLTKASDDQVIKAILEFEFL